MTEPLPTPPAGLEPGAEASIEVTVSEEMTAARVGSGAVAVLATPQIVAMAERAAVLALDGRLPEGTTSVGASVALDHLAPTPVGTDVRATANFALARAMKTNMFRCCPGVNPRGDHPSRR